MTPELSEACRIAGPELVALAAAYLRGVHGVHELDLPVRHALAACLARWTRPGSGIVTDRHDSEIGTRGSDLGPEGVERLDDSEIRTRGADLIPGGVAEGAQIRNGIADLGPDDDLVAAVTPLLTGIASHPVGYRLRVNAAVDDDSPIGRLMKAAWAEVDTALFVTLSRNQLQPPSTVLLGSAQFHPPQGLTSRSVSVSRAGARATQAIHSQPPLAATTRRAEQVTREASCWRASRSPSDTGLHSQAAVAAPLRARVPLLRSSGALPMLEFLRNQLTGLLAERDQALSRMAAPIAAVRGGGGTVMAASQIAAYEAARASVSDLDARIGQVQAGIADAEAQELRAGRVYASNAATGNIGAEQRGSGVRVGAGPSTYRRGDVTAPSWARDMARAALSHDPDALQRLQANNRQVATEFRALTSVDGAGGEFVPPVWLISEYIRVARAGRVVANQLHGMPLPPGTDTINLPRVATGTSVAEQATQNTAVSNTDATTNAVTAAVATLAGQQVVSLQFLEQSPVNSDEVILQDLLAELARQVDMFVISNNAVNKRGLLNVTGLNAVTFTTPVTVPGLYPKLADAIQQIHTGRFLPGQKIFMHPRRWAWLLAATDTATRPLVLPSANTPQNAVAFSTGTVADDGLVGSLHGLPVYVDANIPINLGAGVNEDRIIVARTDDQYLYEALPRAEAFRETKADQMSVLLRVYNYIALHSERYPKSLSVISGAGCVPPSF